MTQQPIYLDYHATTPVDERVLAKMMPFFREQFGNPSSRSHPFGWSAEHTVSDARLQVLQLLGARMPSEIVFTSGATESNALAIRGVTLATGKRHIVTSAIEHACVLDACRSLTEFGVETTIVGVDHTGVVRPEDVEAAMRPDTALVSIMAVNNEVGTIQPIVELARIAHRGGAYFHTDAAQALGRIDINVERDDIDLLSISSHKLYGPKGCGALYVRRHKREVPLQRLLGGGDQEHGLRSGTINVPGVVGLGEACRLAGIEREAEAQRAKHLRDRLLERLRRELEDVAVFGCLERRVGCNLNLCFGAIAADTLLSAIPDLAVSSKAACSSGKAGASHVLVAMGVPPEKAVRAIRVAVGRDTTADEIERAADMLIAAVTRLS